MVCLLRLVCCRRRAAPGSHGRARACGSRLGLRLTRPGWPSAPPWSFRFAGAEDLELEDRDGSAHIGEEARAQHREAVGAPQLRVSEVEAFGEDLVVRCRSRLRRFGFESGCPQALFFLARLRLPNLGRLLGAARRRSCVRPRASRSGAWWCSVQLLVALAFLVGTWRKGPQSSTTPRVAITFSVAEHCSTSSFLPKLRHCLAFQYDQCGPRAATAQK